MDRPLKNLAFRGNSRDDLGSFPESARSEAGHQLYLVQQGRDPEDWRPMSTVGPGVREIRIHDNDGAFRVIYVATFADAVYVLHCFQKKTQQIRKQDIELAHRRYKELAKELRR